MTTLNRVILVHRKPIAVLLASILPVVLGGIGFAGPVEAGQSAPQVPQATCPAGGRCFADVPPDSPFYSYANNLYMQDIISGYACGGPGEPCDDQSRPYYRPGNYVTRAQMTKFADLGRTLPGIRIDTATSSQPLYSRSTAPSGVGVTGASNSGDGVAATSISGNGVYATTVSGAGVYAFSDRGYGLQAQSNSGIGVYATSGEDAGVYAVSSSGFALRAQSTSGIAIYATSSTEHAGYFVNTGSADAGVFGENMGSGEGVQGRSVSGPGVYGYSQGGPGMHGISIKGNGVYGESTTGNAGYFAGNVTITGTCTGCTGPSMTDHPLDPENKYLYYSSVESPDMKNIYDGVAVLDANGEAVVVLPAYFEALNGDFRYQFAPIGAPMPNLYIAEEIKDNRFKIAGGKAGMKVSWQVTGIRHDPYANKHRTPVEVDKPQEERGLYLHPEVYGQPDTKQIGKGDHP